VRRFLPLSIALVIGATVLGGAWWYRQHAPGVVDVAGAWARVRANPRDARAWASLGDAQSAVDELRAAEESYRTALRLSAEEPTVLARLGFLLYGRGEDVQARALLEQAQFQGADLPMLQYTLDRLRQEAPTPADEAPADSAAPAAAPPEQVVAAELPCTLDLEERSTFRITVAINDVTTPLIFDTGASITTLSRDLLEKAGVPIDEESGIQAITAAGPVRFPIGTVGRLGLAGRAVRDLTVAVCEGCGGTTSGGLLGLDVQAALGMQLDLKNRRVHFTDCDTAPRPE